MTAKIKILGPAKIARYDVDKSLSAILRQTPLLAMATSTRELAPYINNAYFFLAPNFLLGFLSFPTTNHVSNFLRRSRAAVSVARSSQICGNPIKGVQLFGRVYKVKLKAHQEFFRGYSRKFPKSRAYCEQLLHAPTPDSAKPYFFEIQRFKLVDERRFGDETYVTGAIVR